MEVKRVDGRFRLKENLGTCTKCSMFRAANLVDTGHTILVKIAQSKHCGLLERELAILDQLRGLPGIPGIIWSGTEFEQDIMIFKDLGPTLDNVFKSTGRMNTIVFLAEHLITFLEHIHSRSYIYSNIRPQNILVGPVLPGQQTNELCLFDFSLAQVISSAVETTWSRSHISYYILHVSKESISVAQLCDTLPSPFTTFLSYAHDLSFTQKPDYNYVLNLFHTLHVDTTAPPPALSPAVEMSERTYWMEDVVSLHPS
ncbi:kinase-like protein [Paxillus ammoniavirescens]|nr:kinase-like protein [Paxillus ammoniavirescens]